MNSIDSLSAHVAQLVEHILGKDEVSGSIPLMGSSETLCAELEMVSIDLQPF
jgi:hypothetical protein